jgi:Mrp family chromosome partitioning ATPase
MTKLPLVGMIPSYAQDECDNAFRILRTNLLHQLQEGQKTILITSADEGDGKTICAVRLSKAFAQMGKKTVVCDLNFRHPTLAKDFGVSDRTGMVTLLQNEDLLPTEIISSAHPADLFAHKKLHEVLANLSKTYDIVILDGPSAGEDNYTVMHGLADVTCFVCRSGKTLKTSIEKLDKMKAENLLAYPCIVLIQS